RRLDSGQTSQLQRSELRRGLIFARGYLLLPLSPSWRLRSVFLWAEERARGLDLGAPFDLSRRDLGARAAAAYRHGIFGGEAGYAMVHSWQQLATSGPPVPFFTPDWTGDKVYASSTLYLGPATARLMISHQLF